MDIGIYQFKESDVRDFARSVNIQTRVRGNELQFKTCPYCGGGSKRDPFTFAINLNDGRNICLRSTCGKQGNMITLSQDFNFSLSKDVDEYFLRKTEYKKLKQPTAKIVPKKNAIDYLKNRGISQEIVEKYEITCMNGNEDILVFPFFDENAEMQFVKYRNTKFEKGVTKGSKEWCEANCKPILFGMKQCEDFTRLVITEGQIDSLTLSECGIKNAVSVPTGAKGFTWIPHVWDWWRKFEELAIFGDFEKGSMTLFDDLKNRFYGKVKFVKPESYLGCKDANEIMKKHGKQAIIDAVNNAKQIDVTRVKDLADVKNVDLSMIPKLQTGIKELDILLKGGLYYGQVDIIAGKRGDGKSTFASQIIANALNQDNNVFIYSAELRTSDFKSWIDMQLAGSRHIISKTCKDGYETHYVPNSEISKITEWYRGKAYIYDTDIIETDEKEDLLKIIEQSIKQYGIKVILLDNLMTAIDLYAEENTNKYDLQGKFVRDLVKIAIRYNVLILLVAHRRKNNTTTDANDEISGSADITNLAGVVLSYDRDRELPDTQRKLILSKSRFVGKLCFDGIVLNYDERSKRVYGEMDDQNFVYGWEKDEQGFLNATEEEMMMFS